jgi:hypothetical protein
MLHRYADNALSILGRTEQQRNTVVSREPMKHFTKSKFLGDLEPKRQSNLFGLSPLLLSNPPKRI